jgi:hypothetical protein
MTQERERVRPVVVELQQGIGHALVEWGQPPLEMPLSVTLLLESALIREREKGRREGVQAGYTLARRVQDEIGPRDPATPPPVPEAAKRPRSYTPISHPPPPPLDSRDVTPVRPVDWTGPRRDES